MSQMYVISIISKRDDKAFFNKCGVGWENRDGSINFTLDIFNGTQFHLRKAKSDAEEPPQSKEQPRGKR